MLKINKVVITSIFIFIQLSLIAQNNTNSPYTRFGYGELADRSFGAGRAMGGIGYGLRSSKQINPMNPASYSSLDTLTFLMDFGASMQLSWFNDGINKQNNINGNVEYIAMEFPIIRGIAMSIGLLPYSYVGYNFGQTGKNEEGTSYIENYVGTGGLNELYGGLSIEVWKKRLSVGANFGFIFGNITHEQNLSFGSTSSSYSVYQTKRLEVRDLKMDFGVQYVHPISAKENITLGVVFSPANKLNTDSYESIVSTQEQKGDTVTGLRFDLPNSYGVGLSYTKENKLMVGADFSYETWKNADFFSKTDEFKNRMKVAVGAEFIPHYNNRLFLNRVQYRAGFHYSNSYLKVKGSSYDEYGASVGFGLPLIDGRSYINVGFEYNKVKPTSPGLIDEQYFRFTVNYTFNEFWFFKRKI